MKKYDLIIVGAGPSGIFTALQTKKRFPKAKILMIEKGRSIKNRVCPKRITGECANCIPCNITTGFSGAGAFSDGKLSINEHGEVGGELATYIGYDEFKRVLKYTDQIYLDFGADKKVYGLENTEELQEIENKAIASDLKLIKSGVRHLGTDKAFEIYSKLQDYLEKLKIEMIFESPVKDIIVENEEVIGVTIKEKEYYGKKVILSVGREGSKWLFDLCKKHNIKTDIGTVDVGVRVECNSSITDSVDKVTYESKLVHYTKTFDDKVRTFCWNPRGVVSEERYDNDLALVNGHSYKEEELKTNNTNFALLVSKNFTEPFKSPIEYGLHVAELANMLTGRKVMVQTYGDFKRGRRTNEKRLSRNNTKPTLTDAVPGDLSLVLPYRIMLSVVEMIEVLDNLMPGLAGNGTLLYGPEVKFYSNQIKVFNNFETNIKNLHVLGDGAGITRGLIQASMNGIAFADALKLEK